MKVCLFAVLLLAISSAEATFDDIDLDHNGGIDRNEFMFAALDRNHDGVVDFDEFTELPPTADAKPVASKNGGKSGKGFKDDSMPAKSSSIKGAKPPATTGGFAAGMALLKKLGTEAKTSVKTSLKSMEKDAMKIFKAAREAVKAKKPKTDAKGAKSGGKGAKGGGKAVMAATEDTFSEDFEEEEDETLAAFKSRLSAAPRSGSCDTAKSSLGSKKVTDAFTLIGGVHETVLLRVGTKAILMEYGGPHSLMCTELDWKGPPVDQSGNENRKLTTSNYGVHSRVGCVASGRQAIDYVLSRKAQSNNCMWWTFNSMVRKGKVYGTLKRVSAGKTLASLIDIAVQFESTKAGYSLLYNNCQHLASTVFNAAITNAGLGKASTLLTCAPLGFRTPVALAVNNCW